MHDKLKDKIRSLVTDIENYKAPGVSIAVVNDYKIEWAEGFGVAEMGREQAVTPKTLFQSASISKAVFALAVMKLAAKGVLDLDADVNTYLPSWQVTGAMGWQPQVTLRQILSHRAGLTVHGFPGYPVNTPLPSLERVLQGEEPANTGKVLVDTLPGLQFRYSGGGTTAAQLIVETVVGKPLPEIMEELILQPLGMHNSTYCQPLPKEKASQAATAHVADNKPVDGKYHVYPEMAAAGLWTTPTDLALLGIAVQRALKGDEQIFTQTMVKEMLTPLDRVYLGGGDEIGIGFFLRQTGGSLWFGHDGGNHGFTARFIMSKDFGAGCAIMVNANTNIIVHLENEIGLAYDWPGYSRDTSSFVGTYVTSEGHRFAFDPLPTGEISMQYDNQPALKLQFVRQGIYYSPEIMVVVRFSPTLNGRVQKVTLLQNHQLMEATRA